MASTPNAVYFSPNLSGQYQYELYDQDMDNGWQLNNLLHQPAEEIKPLWSTLQVKCC